LLAGEYEKAIDALHRAIGAGYQESKTYNNLGLALCKLGRYSEALEVFRNGGNEASAYNNVGCIYLDQGKYKEAIKYFERAIEISPTYHAQAGENLTKARMAYRHRQ
jgi:pentatricopeptide repeat protein